MKNSIEYPFNCKNQFLYIYVEQDSQTTVKLLVQDKVMQNARSLMNAFAAWLLNLILSIA